MWSQDQLQRRECEDQPARRLQKHEGLVHPRGDSQHKLSMNELGKKYHITYDSWEGYNVEHIHNGAVRFHKDENELPYIDLKGSE